VLITVNVLLFATAVVLTLADFMRQGEEDYNSSGVIALAKRGIKGSKKKKMKSKPLSEEGEYEGEVSELPAERGVRTPAGATGRHIRSPRRGHHMDEIRCLKFGL